MVVETSLIVLCMIAVLIGPAVIIAMFGRSLVKASARNPSSTTKLFVLMLILLVFVEVISIATIIMIFRLFQA